MPGFPQKYLYNRSKSTLYSMSGPTKQFTVMETVVRDHAWVLGFVCPFMHAMRNIRHIWIYFRVWLWTPLPENRRGNTTFADSIHQYEFN